MPPKKKPVSGPVGVYDVEIMNEDELKQYIEALKEESERMKAAFTDHQRDKRELEDLLSDAQEDILSRYRTLMQKEIELQELLSESHDILKDEDKKHLIEELETNKKLAQNTIDNFIEVQEIDMFRQDELKKLQKNLNDRNREVENINLTHRLISTDLKEQTEEEWVNMMEKRKHSLEEISEEFNEKYLEERRKLVEEEENIMNTIIDSLFGKDSDKYPSTNEVEKMSWYFKDLFWKNLKASANLKVRVESLETELNKLKMLLRDAENENKELLQSIEASNYSSKNNNDQAVPEKDDFDDKQLDYLTYENYTLNEKLRQVTEERNVLRNKFISAMRSIYKKADFASFLAEQMIASLLKDGQNLNEKSLNAYLQDKDQKATTEASRVNQEYDMAEIHNESSSSIC
ncbi:testis-specific gene 10 protein-like [Argiope bruennichi]|uniref:testis-specific gene 10 protein-like n=1 Tax=Argiope bruennichi TaxID=94029 RepID=UPI0024954809|nr:testis-specific gene 10 protein-like [Argiope bruennichi]